jgi:hypothetical protein
MGERFEGMSEVGMGNDPLNFSNRLRLSNESNILASSNRHTTEV